jgi:hypothetical protein
LGISLRLNVDVKTEICIYYLTRYIARGLYVRRTDEVLHSELNQLVMDYLVIGGYKNAAEFFSHEANVPPAVDLKSIESRMNIREALQRGDVQDAIMRVNDLNPEVRQGLSL